MTLFPLFITTMLTLKEILKKIEIFKFQVSIRLIYFKPNPNRIMKPEPVLPDSGRLLMLIKYFQKEIAASLLISVSAY